MFEFKLTPSNFMWSSENNLLPSILISISFSSQFVYISRNLSWLASIRFDMNHVAANQDSAWFPSGLFISHCDVVCILYKFNFLII